MTGVRPFLAYEQLSTLCPKLRLSDASVATATCAVVEDCQQRETCGSACRSLKGGDGNLKLQPTTLGKREGQAFTCHVEGSGPCRHNHHHQHGAWHSI